MFDDGFAYSTALVKYLVMEYKLPDGPLASEKSI